MVSETRNDSDEIECDAKYILCFACDERCLPGIPGRSLSISAVRILVSENKITTNKCTLFIKARERSKRESRLKFKFEMSFLI